MLITRVAKFQALLISNLLGSVPLKVKVVKEGAAVAAPASPDTAE